MFRWTAQRAVELRRMLDEGLAPAEAAPALGTSEAVIAAKILRGDLPGGSPRQPPGRDASRGLWADPGRINRLLQLWGTRLKADEVAAAMNAEFGCTGYSKNGVVGKLYRLRNTHPGQVPTGNPPGHYGTGASTKRRNVAGRPRVAHPIALAPSPKPRDVKLPLAPRAAAVLRAPRKPRGVDGIPAALGLACDAAPALPPLNVGLLDRPDDGCAFATGDSGDVMGGVLFCGRPRLRYTSRMSGEEIPAPYCEYHCRRAYSLPAAIAVSDRQAAAAESA